MTILPDWKRFTFSVSVANIEEGESADVIYKCFTNKIELFGIHVDQIVTVNRDGAKVMENAFTPYNGVHDASHILHLVASNPFKHCADVCRAIKAVHDLVTYLHQSF